jgi:hypothetical protein
MSNLPKINVNARLVRLAATCMATMDIRYYLNGIYVEPREAGGCFIVATDGHRLMAVIDPTGQASVASVLAIDKRMVARMPKTDARLLYDDIKQELRNSSKKGTVTYRPGISNRLRTTEFDGKLAVLLTDVNGLVEDMRSSALIEGRFPVWQKVVPADFSKLKPTPGAIINIDYLHGMLAAFKPSKHKVRVFPNLLQNHDDPNSCVVVHIHGHEYALGIIMPMRADALGGATELFTKNWTTDARRAYQPADTKAQDAVAVPAERGGDAQGQQAQAGAELAAAATQAQAGAPTQQTPT